jgi:hypothetical protein
MDTMQVQTPPKDDEIDEPSAPSPVEFADVAIADDKDEQEEDDEKIEEIAVEPPRIDEAKNGDDEDEKSELSSAPASEDEGDTSKSGNTLSILTDPRSQAEKSEAFPPRRSKGDEFRRD